VVLLGPTAVGKTRVAEHLAVALDGEIIGVDSMQVYRGLDAGTAKPSAESRRRVRYHLVDVAEVTVDFNLGDFVRAAEGAVSEVRARGSLPILAGGTGMYLRGFLKGLDPAPPRDPALRDRLAQLADRRGPSHLHRILALHDRATAGAIHDTDRMRLVRALERVLLTGRRVGTGRWSAPDRYATVKIGLSREPIDLRRRIGERVEAMFAAGLVEETAALLGAGVSADGSALKALGYREVVQHLRGERDLAETVESVKRHTWKFTRRQAAWFRREDDVRWFPVAPGTTASVCPDVEKYARLRLTLA